MSQNNGNGNRPKLDPELNQEVRVRLLKDKPYTGENGFGKYYLYSVENTQTGEELAFFAPDYIHTIIEEHNLIKGSEFLVKKVPHQNGNKKITSMLELSLVSMPSPEHKPTNGSDNLRETLLQCVRDAANIVDEVKNDVAFRVEDLRSLSLTLFIARTKLGNGFH
jgi:hypothetical protein